MSTLVSRIPADFPAKWILCWLLLPNIVIVLMWQVAGKPMQAFILMSGIAALIISQVPSRFVRTAGAIAIFSMISVFYVARLFGIPPLNLAVVAQFIAEVRPLRSPEYVLAGVVVAALLILVVRVTPGVEVSTAAPSISMPHSRSSPSPWPTVRSRRPRESALIRRSPGRKPIRRSSRWDSPRRQRRAATSS